MAEFDPSVAQARTRSRADTAAPDGVAAGLEPRSVHEQLPAVAWVAWSSSHSLCHRSWDPSIHVEAGQSILSTVDIHDSATTFLNDNTDGPVGIVDTRHLRVSNKLRDAAIDCNRLIIAPTVRALRYV